MTHNLLNVLLGANGTIGSALIPVLQKNGEPMRLVSRRPMKVDGAETFVADALDRERLFEAVKGSAVVYLVIGLLYDSKTWEKDWPVIMRNVIDACKSSNAKLVFFDNVYMYGRVHGYMSETTPYKPVSRKGKVRAAIATMLQNEMKEGTIKAIIARAVDFYGPNVTDKSAAGVLVFSNMKKKKKAQWFINANVPRSYSYVPDAVAALYKLAKSESAYGQVWHLPAVKPPLTGKEFIELAAKYMGASDKFKVLPKFVLKLIGLFNPFLREIYEMHYQDEYPFLFDSSKFEREFWMQPTGYDEAIKTTAEWYLAH
ncbi:MAG: NAD-dependent epimerase/dehydratase family protein [Chitinophagaceae bacterium]|nr:MAG: NAD-dependent epimerase/dehydratase family protein [Chitinophagaceae bacterium]